MPDVVREDLPAQNHIDWNARLQAPLNDPGNAYRVMEGPYRSCINAVTRLRNGKANVPGSGRWEFQCRKHPDNTKEGRVYAIYHRP